MSERRATIKLVLEWLEKHPEKAKQSEDKLRSLIGVYGSAGKAIREIIPQTGRLSNAMRIARQVFDEKKVALLTTTKSQEFMNEVIKRLVKEEEEAAKHTKTLADRFTGISKKITSVGYRLGWFAFRTMVVGRMIMRWLITPIKKGIDSLISWERSLDTTVTAMALLAATGQLTGERASNLQDIMTNLIKVGPEFQGAWSYIQSTLIGIASDIATPLIPGLLDLADAIMDTWEAVEPTLIPALETLVDSVFPPLIDLIEKLGPTLIESFVDGIQQSIPLVMGLIDALEPFLPTLASIIGFLLPFAPILVAVGLAAYLLSPILIALGSLLSIVGTILSVGVIPFLSILGSLLLSIAAAVAVGYAVFNILKDVIGPVPALIVAIVAAIATGVGIFLLFSKVLGFAAIVAGAASPAITALGVSVGAAGVAAAPAIGIVLALGAAVLMAGAGFLLAGVGVLVAVNALIQLGQNLSLIAPLVPVLLGIAAGLLGIAAAGIGMLPAAIGVGAMALAMIGLSVAVIAVSVAIWGLIAAAKAFDAVGNVVTGVIGGIANALSGLCFKHATPLVEKFTGALQESNEEMVNTVSDLNSLKRGLLDVEGVGVGGVSPGGVGAGGAATITQEIYAPVTIEHVDAEVDMDELREQVIDGVAEGVRRAKE